MTPEDPLTLGIEQHFMGLTPARIIPRSDNYPGLCAISIGSGREIVANGDPDETLNVVQGAVGKR